MWTLCVMRLRADGATDAYDFPYPARFNAQGHRMACNEAATAQSWQALGGAWPERQPSACTAFIGGRGD